MSQHHACVEKEKGDAFVTSPFKGLFQVVIISCLKVFP